MKTLDFMNIKTQELTREEMRNITAGCGGSGGGNCHIYISKDGQGYWADNCYSVGQAQFYYSGGSGNGWLWPGGWRTTGYCCASCGTDGFSGAPSSC
jgi:hypothetical protein